MHHNPNLSVNEQEWLLATLEDVYQGHRNRMQSYCVRAYRLRVDGDDLDAAEEAVTSATECGMEADRTQQIMAQLRRSITASTAQLRR